MVNIYQYRAVPDRLSDLLPWAALVAPGVVLNKDGSLQSTIRYRGPDLDSSTQSELIVNAAQINNILRRLGSGWALYSDAQRAPATPYPTCTWPNDITQAIDDERKEEYTANPRYTSQYYATLIYLPPRETQNRASNLFVRSSVESEPFSYEKLLDSFQSEVHRVLDLFTRIFPEAAVLTDDETLTYLHALISTKQHLVTAPTIPMYLDSLLTDTNVVGGMEPMLGDHHLSVLSVLGYPHQSCPGLLDDLNKLSIPYRWSVRFIFLDKAEAKAELENYKRKWFSKRKSLQTLIKELITKEESILSDSEALQKAEDADGALAELGEGLVSFGYCSTTIVLSDISKEALRTKTAQVERLINGLGFVVRRETVNAVDAWLGSLPGNTRNNVRRPILNTLNLSHLIPGASALWDGQSQNPHLSGPPLIIAATEGSTPFRFSLHVGDVGHTLVLGPTGSGKSSLLNLIEAQFLKYKDAQVYIFDKGRSALALTQGVGGDHYDLGSSDCSLALQPLRAIDTPDELSWAHDFIVSIVAHENVTVTPEIKAHLWEALQTLATTPPEHRTLHSLVVFIQNTKLRSSLEPFTMLGPYGALIDNSFDNLEHGSWCCFEMENLMETPAVVPFVLSYLFHRLEQRFQGAPTLLVLDEAWMFLDHPAFSLQIRQWLKTLRKKNVSVVFATQSLSDVDQSSIAPTLKEACFTKIYLPNQAALQPDASAFYSRFGLNTRQIEIIAQATPKHDYYYTSPLGNRLFSLPLGKVALTYCASANPSNTALIRGIKGRTQSTQAFNEQYQVAHGLERSVSTSPNVRRAA